MNDDLGKIRETPQRTLKADNARKGIKTYPF